MLDGLNNPSYGTGVWLQILIALTIYVAFNKASLLVMIPWMVWLMRDLFSGSFYSAQDFLNSMNGNSLMLVSLFLTAVMIAFTLIYLRRIEKRPLSAAGLSPRLAVPRYLMGFVGGAIALAVSYAWPLLDVGITYTGFTYLVPIYLAAFIIQSASEELLFRGLLVPGISRKLGLLPAVLISSGLFSIAHALNGGYTILGAIYYLLIGAFLALLMLRTDSLWASCGFHGAWNFTIGLLVPMSLSGLTVDYAIFHTNSVIEEAPPSVIGDPFYLILIGIFAILIALLLFVGQNKLVVRAPAPPEGAASTPDMPPFAPQMPPTGPYYPQPGMPYFQPMPGNMNYPPAPGAPLNPPQPGMPYYPPMPGQQNVPPQPGIPYHPPQPGMPYYPPMPETQNVPPQSGAPYYQPQPGMPYYPPMPPQPGTPYYPPQSGMPYYPPMPGQQNVPPQPGAPYYPPQPGMPYYPPMPGTQNVPPQPGAPYYPPQPGMPYYPPMPGTQNMPPQPGIPYYPPAPGARNPSPDPQPLEETPHPPHPPQQEDGK